MTSDTRFNLFLTLALVLLVLAVVEGFGIDLAQVPQPGVITAVHEGGVTRWSNNNRTSVRFSDGYVQEFTGLYGKPGETVTVDRVLGLKSVFGITGEYTYREIRAMKRKTRKMEL